MASASTVEVMAREGSEHVRGQTGGVGFDEVAVAGQALRDAVAGRRRGGVEIETIPVVVFPDGSVYGLMSDHFRDDNAPDVAEVIGPNDMRRFDDDFVSEPVDRSDEREGDYGPIDDEAGGGEAGGGTADDVWVQLWTARGELELAEGGQERDRGVTDAVLIRLQELIAEIIVQRAPARAHVESLFHGGAGGRSEPGAVAAWAAEMIAELIPGPARLAVLARARRTAREAEREQ